MNGAALQLRPIDWAVVILPIALAPVLLFPKTASLAVLAVPAAIAVIRLIRDGRVAPPSPLGVPMLLLAAAVIASGVVTPGLDQSAGKLGGIALGVLTLWGVVVFSESRRAWMLVVAGYFACGVLIAGLSLVGTTWEAKIEFMRPLVSLFPVRWKGMPGAEDGFDANPVGATMTMFVMVGAAATLHLVRGRVASLPQTWHSVLAAGTGAFTLLVFGVLVLSQSRSAWMGFALGAAAMWVCLRRSWRAWAGALVVLACIGAGVVSTLPASRGATPSSLGEVVAAQGRGELWSRGLMVVRDFPITGIGPNIFRLIVPVAYPPFDSPPATPVPHAHNGLIQTAIDFGLPGLTAYVAVWTVFVALLVRLVRRSTDAALRRLAAGLLAGAVAIAAFQMTDAIPLGAKVGTLWWVMVGLASAAACLEFGTRPAARGDMRPAAIWLAASAAAVLLAAHGPLLAIAAAVAGGIACGLQAVTGFEFTHGMAARPAQR